MDNSLLYMYISMILALLLGFFIGWILRRNAYRKRYEDNIYELQYLEDEKLEKVTTAKANLENLQNLHMDNKDSFRIKSERLNSYVEKDKKLKAEINETRSQNEAWVKNTPIVDEQIDEALVNLDRVKSAKDSFIAQIEELNSCERKIVELTSDIERIELIITPTLERKNELKKSLESLTARIEQQQNQLDKIDIQTIESKDEYASKKSSVEKEFATSQKEEEEYSLMLETIEDKIINNQELSSSDFKGVFKEPTNSSSGWINGLYKKSKNLFKGEE